MSLLFIETEVGLEVGNQGLTLIPLCGVTGRYLQNALLVSRIPGHVGRPLGTEYLLKAGVSVQTFVLPPEGLRLTGEELMLQLRSAALDLVHWISNQQHLRVLIQIYLLFVRRRATKSPQMCCRLSTQLIFQDFLDFIHVGI